jgi:branched-chain amino acid transport system ATP-binding protein
MLEIEDLHASYGSVLAVVSASVSVRQGQIVALIGSNGAGKSTLLRCISGVRRARISGHVYFEGRDLVGRPAYDIARRGIVMVAEERRIFLPLTIEENLKVGWVGRGGGEFRASLERVFDTFPMLASRRTSVAGSLSGGQQQMLAIGRAILTNPKVLLLDEPSLGLAPFLVEKMFEAITSLAHAGQTVLLSEQNAAWATEVASWIYVMRRGRVVRNGPAADFEHGRAALDAYL